MLSRQKKVHGVTEGERWKLGEMGGEEFEGEGREVGGSKQVSL